MGMISVILNAKNIYKNKRILVVGMARSGIGAANLLFSLGADVLITDQKPLEGLAFFAKKLHPAIQVQAGGYPVHDIHKINLVVLSPGVPMSLPFLNIIREHRIPIIGELELAYRISGSPFIAITGTNGKTTTTTLTDLMLKKSGFKTILCGNIGKSAAEAILENANLPQPDFFVSEVSSFQLETIIEFKARIAAILNITPDHFDRHHSMDEYVFTKSKIFMNQGKKDFLILNLEDPSLTSAAKKKKENVLFFSSRKETEGFFIQDEWVCYKFPSRSGKLLPVHEIPMKGIHNMENVMAASAIAMSAGCPVDVIRHVIRGFKGLPHRLESIASVDNIKFINDSKGTNVHAVGRAIENFTKLILIMGGKDKDGDFSVLRNLVKERVKLLMLYGEARFKIASKLKGVTKIILTESLEDAVMKSHAHAVSGDVVLLSPGCASFDMFRDYQERGEIFRKRVLEITVSG